MWVANASGEPLEGRTVGPTRRDHSLGVGGKADIHNVGRVPTEGMMRGAIKDSGVLEEADGAIIVSAHDHAPDTWQMAFVSVWSLLKELMQ